MLYRNNHYGPIDKFCSRHPRFGIPNLMMYIAFAQVAVFFVDLLFRGWGSSILCFWGPDILRGQVWRLFTFVLVPNSGNPFYLLLGCRSEERRVGKECRL